MGLRVAWLDEASQDLVHFQCSIDQRAIVCVVDMGQPTRVRQWPICYLRGVQTSEVQLVRPTELHKTSREKVGGCHGDSSQVVGVYIIRLQLAKGLVCVVRPHVHPASHVSQVMRGQRPVNYFLGGYTSEVNGLGVGEHSVPIQVCIVVADQIVRQHIGCCGQAVGIYLVHVQCTCNCHRSCGDIFHK